MEALGYDDEMRIDFFDAERALELFDGELLDHLLVEIVLTEQVLQSYLQGLLMQGPRIHQPFLNSLDF
jgi:hypothetical protein